MQPVQSLLGVNVVSICAGTRHLLILTSDNELFGLGSNEEGRCGLKSQAINATEPEIVATDDYVINRIFCGINNSILADSAGNLYSTGSNRNNKSGLLIDASNVFKTSFKGYKLPPNGQISLGAQNTVIQLDKTEFLQGILNYVPFFFSKSMLLTYANWATFLTYFPLYLLAPAPTGSSKKFNFNKKY